MQTFFAKVYIFIARHFIISKKGRHVVFGLGWSHSWGQINSPSVTTDVRLPVLVETRFPAKKFFHSWEKRKCRENRQIFKKFREISLLKIFSRKCEWKFSKLVRKNEHFRESFSFYAFLPLGILLLEDMWLRNFETWKFYLIVLKKHRVSFYEP